MSAAPLPSGARAIRVMLVDDSAVVRGLARRWIEEAPGVELVGQCSDGAQAVALAASCNPDVIILDVEMPKMDGLAALPLLRRAAPRAQVVMASGLTSKGATVTIKALSLGAADYIAKPESTSLGGADTYRRDLIEKVMALGQKNVAPASPSIPGRSSAQVRLRPPPLGLAPRPQALVVAASTGGPAALQAFLTPIARRIQQPILIVQHMPATFTPVFAEKLAQVCGKPCREPKDGDVVGPGSFYLAPGDFHMRLAKAGASIIIRLDKGDPVNFCRPAADPMFDTAASIWGQRLLGVVLTGMGADGRNGAGRIVSAGGRVFAQDEASSVVWGMPGAVATAGHAEGLGTPTDLANTALRILNGDAA
jgi:two-component system, chemotaxis family, protein-glutamate methylesterase/glutaminase